MGLKESIPIKKDHPILWQDENCKYLFMKNREVTIHLIFI